MWLPPPVPVWRPSSANFSVPRRQKRASSYSAVGHLVELGPRPRRVDVDLEDPRIGRHRQLLQAVVGRRRVALEAQRLIALAGDVLDGARPAPATPRGTRRGGRKTCRIALANLHAERRAHQARIDRRDRAPRGARPRPLLGPLVGGPCWTCGMTRVSGGRGEQRIALVDPGARLLGLPGQAVERQPEAERRVAGDQEQLVAAQRPGAALPGDGPGRRCWARARSGST